MTFGRRTHFDILRIPPYPLGMLAWPPLPSTYFTTGIVEAEGIIDDMTLLHHFKVIYCLYELVGSSTFCGLLGW